MTAYVKNKLTFRSRQNVWVQLLFFAYFYLLVECAEFKCQNFGAYIKGIIKKESSLEIICFVLEKNGKNKKMSSFFIYLFTFNYSRCHLRKSIAKNV